MLICRKKVHGKLQHIFITHDALRSGMSVQASPEPASPFATAQFPEAISFRRPRKTRALISAFTGLRRKLGLDYVLVLEKRLWRGLWTL